MKAGACSAIPTLTLVSLAQRCSPDAEMMPPPPQLPEQAPARGTGQRLLFYRFALNPSALSVAARCLTGSVTGLTALLRAVRRGTLGSGLVSFSMMTPVVRETRMHHSREKGKGATFSKRGACRGRVPGITLKT